jgi:hypothetical protein
MKDASGIDYPHVHQLYAWTTSSKGGGWFVFPTIIFALLCVGAMVLFVIFHHWAFLLGAGFFYGACEKRNGMKEGFVLGYEAGHDEAFIGKKDFTKV